MHRTYLSTLQARLAINEALMAISNGYILIKNAVFGQNPTFSHSGVLEATRGKTEETMVGIKVAYDISEQFKSTFGHK